MVVGDDDGFGAGYGRGLDDYNFSQKECLSSSVGLEIVPEFSDLDSMLLMAQALLSTGKAQSGLGWQGKAKTTYEEAGRVSERCLKMLKSCKESSDEDARRSLEVAKLFEASFRNLNGKLSGKPKILKLWHILLQYLEVHLQSLH